MAKPTTSSTKKVAAKAKPARKVPAKAATKPVVKAAVTQTAKPVAVAKAAAPVKSRNTPGLHYNKDDLLADYTQTYSVFMKMLAIGIGGALVYFFIMIVYLGAFGHTPTNDYVREFGTRIDYGYKGLRLPQYDDPSILQTPANSKEAH